MAESMPDTVVYVSNAGSKEIYAFAMDRDNGELILFDKVPVPGTDKPSPGSMPMAVAPDHRFLYAALRSDNFPASSFAIDPRERAPDPHRDHAAARQHGLHRDRPDRPVSAERLLSGQQADDQSDRRQRPCPGQDDASDRGQAQGALHSGRSDQQILLRDQPWERHDHGVEIRPRERDVVAQRAGRGPHQSGRRAAAHGAAPQSSAFST